MPIRFECPADADGVSDTGTSGQGPKTHFLAALAAGRSVRVAAQLAGIAPSTAYKWRAADAEFQAEWCAAEEAGTDIIEEEAFRRAVTGVEKPVYRGGEVVGHVSDYSDTMLMFLLKSRRPERYGSHGKGIAGSDSGSLAKRLNLDEARDALLRKFSSIAAGPKKASVSGEPDRD